MIGVDDVLRLAVRPTTDRPPVPVFSNNASIGRLTGGRELFPLADIAWAAHRRIMKEGKWREVFTLEFDDVFGYPSDDRNHGHGKALHASNRVAEKVSDFI